MTRNVKNLLMLMVAFLATTAFAACGDDGDGDSGGSSISGLIVSPTSLSFSKSGGKQTVSAQSAVQASATSSADWCVVTTGTQSANMKVTPISVTVDANPTTAERTAIITVSAGTETKTVSVTQEAGDEPQPTPDPDPSGDITKNAMQIAKLMWPGWNLGNTMEGGNNANNYKNAGINTETAWQSTKTTQDIISFVKSQGFKSVRIPTAWVMGHITNEAEMTIDEAWLNRVAEIVNYCIAADLYVLVNDHWDGGWLENSFDDISTASVTKNSEKLAKLWTQIADRFKDYDDHLIFGGLNEPNCDTQAKTNALLTYEQAFINAVRATGGNNAKRTLVVQGPSTDITKTDDWYDVTKLSDPAGAGYLMVEVHYYDPAQFTGVWEGNQPFWFWGSANHVSGEYKNYNSNWGEESHLQSQFKKMKTKFADKGYPVIMGEYGANWRKLPANQAEHDASIKLFHKTVVQQGVANGMVPMVWDINVANQNGTDGIMTVVNRATLTIYCTPAYEGITEGAAAAAWPY